MRAAERPVSEQAAAWLATLSDEACTKEERREFALWLVRANTHVDEFLRVSALTRRLQGARSWPDIDLDQLVSEARAENSVRLLRPDAAAPNFASGRGSLRTDGAAPRPASRGRWLALAAAVSLLALAALFAWQRPDGARHGQSYETRRGELRSVALDDGSIVELNAKSRILARFSKAERHIELQSGEAVFRVAHSPERPFRVSTPFADIVAVGTQFNVDARADKTVVTVLEGRVKVMRQPETSSSLPVLAAGEQVEIRRERATRHVTRVDPVRVTGWTARRLYFEDTPLAEAVGEFERHSARHIRIDDPALASRRISGTFDASDPGALVQFLVRYGDTTVEESGSGWRVGRSSKAGDRP